MNDIYSIPDDSEEKYELVMDHGDFVGRYVDEAAAELQKQLPDAKTRKIAAVIINRMRNSILAKI